MEKTRIMMPLYGYFPSDPRVRKEVLSLVKNKKNEIEIICIEADTIHTKIPRTKIVPLMPSGKKRKRESVFGLIKFWILTTLYLLRQEKGYIIHAHDLTALPPIILPRLFKKTNHVIYDSHEFFPEAAHEELGVLFSIFFLYLEKFCMKFVTTVVGISPPQKYLMTKRYGKPYILIPNYPSLETIKQIGKQTPLKVHKDKIDIISHGVIRKSREYFTLIDVMKKLEKRTDIALIVIGDGPDFEELQEYTKNLKLENVTFLGRLPFTETFRYLKGGDIAIGMHDLSFNSQMGCSNKLYECMAAGIPTIYSDLIASRYAMDKAFVQPVNPTKVDEIEKMIIDLVADKELREKAAKIGVELFKTTYNWEKIIEPLVKLYDSL